MKKETAIKLFEQKQIRSIWIDDEEKWFFSIVDVIGVLTDSQNPQVYWRVLKKDYFPKETKPLQIVTV
nr:hypothetical protein [uncultured Flavobacterium sp.]